jgi:hypothetical protein
MSADLFRVAFVRCASMRSTKGATTAYAVATVLRGSLLAMPVLWASWSEAAPSAMRLAAATGLVCDIRASLEPEGLHLQAIAGGAIAVAGQYTLSVAKESTSGSSQNLQSGNFHTDGAHEQILATVILDRSAAGHYRATLSLDWNEGQMSCNSP